MRDIRPNCHPESHRVSGVKRQVLHASHICHINEADSCRTDAACARQGDGASEGPHPEQQIRCLGMGTTGGIDTGIASCVQGSPGSLRATPCRFPVSGKAVVSVWETLSVLCLVGAVEGLCRSGNASERTNGRENDLQPLSSRLPQR